MARPFFCRAAIAAAVACVYTAPSLAAPAGQAAKPAAADAASEGPRDAGPHNESKQRTDSDGRGTNPQSKTAPEEPIDFRCDRMDIKTKPNQTFCYDNVVVRRGPLLLCCEVFRGVADDEWQWEKLYCTGDVRAHRGIELMWSNKAEFQLATSDLILTGKPLLHRANSRLTGDRLVVNVDSENAKVDNPRGHMRQTDAPGPTMPSRKVHEGPLPARCPLPPSPAR